MQEVLFLLKNLLDREQITIKAILSCLIDVGTVHLINDRVRIRPLRPLARPLAKVSKPALIFVAHRWVQKKCPQLITQWLQGRILRETKRPQAPQVTVEPIALYQHEIRRLRSRVHLTTGALVGVSSVLVLALLGIDVKSVSPVWQFSSSNRSFDAVIQNHKP